MKKPIAAKLKTKFDGVSEAIVDRHAAKMAKTITREEDIDAAVEAVTLQILIDSYGDSRATEAAQTAVTNYEKKHGLAEGKMAEGGQGSGSNKPPKAEEDDDTPKWAKEVIDANKALRAEIDALKGSKTIETRRSQLIAAVSKAPAQFKTRAEKEFDKSSFLTNEDWNGWFEEVKTDAEALATQLNAKGATFQRPLAGGALKGDEVPKHLTDHFEGKNKEGGQNF